MSACPQCAFDVPSNPCGFCGRPAARVPTSLIGCMGVMTVLTILGVWHIIAATGPFWRAFASTMGAGW